LVICDTVILDGRS